MIRSLKPLIATLLLIASAFFCLFTNPTESAYIHWASQYYLNQEASSHKGLTKLFIETLRTNSIETHTTSTNYLLFTFFQTKDEHICLQAIGILDHFIPLTTLSL